MAVLASCSVEEQESEKIMRKNRLSYVATPVVGKTVYLEDNYFVLSCVGNEYSFWMSRERPECTAINKIYDGELNLTIRSSDSQTVNIEAQRNRQNSNLVINDETYHCYYYSGKVYTKKGDEIQNWFGMVFMSRQVVTKPSELKPDQIDFVAHREQNLCGALH